MVRQRMVTRTIKAYTAHRMTVDTSTATAGMADITFTGTNPVPHFTNYLYKLYIFYLQILLHT